MPREPETITDPLIELLAIKLFEHDRCSGHGTVLHALATSTSRPGWLAMDPEDRESYRKMARGEDSLDGHMPDLFEERD